MVVILSSGATARSILIERAIYYFDMPLVIENRSTKASTTAATATTVYVVAFAPFTTAKTTVTAAGTMTS